MKHLPDIIFWTVVSISNVFLFWEFLSSQRSKTLSQNDAEEYVANRLGVSKWRARLIILDEKEKLVNQALTELLAHDLIQIVPDRIDQYGESMYEFTKKGEILFENTAKLTGKRQDQLKIDIERMISEYRDNQKIQ